MFLIVLDPTAFSADYLDRVETHLTRLHSAYGIDFGRHVPEVTEPQLGNAVYQRLVAAGDSRATSAPG